MSICAASVSQTRGLYTIARMTQIVIPYNWNYLHNSPASWCPRLNIAFKWLLCLHN